MAQPELERRRSVSEYSAPSGGDFQGIGSFDPMMGWEAAQRSSFRLPIIVSMSPPGYPSAWVHPCRARLRFTWRSHCNSAPSISFNFRMVRPTGIGRKADDTGKVAINYLLNISPYGNIAIWR